ncbi:MAG TPA: NADH-quinone oxidoreductase subunit B [Fibrobacteres bacterium]|jgi:NADH-quinone oxidoreductase subunit B|nr:NADH-quinone oxidoreductase subunit B [Fibrobacterota bacterium]
MGVSESLNDVITTKLSFAINWGRANSVWPMPFGVACCAIEMMAAYMPKYDSSRFGAEVLKFSPRQSDLLIVSGRISLKMMPVLQRIWEQMPEPKWCISMGACASSGGVFDTYALIQGIDQFIPVDAYMPGCPPRPEAFVDALMAIQEKAKQGKAKSDEFIVNDPANDPSLSPVYRSPDNYQSPYVPHIHGDKT